MGTTTLDRTTRAGATTRAPARLAALGRAELTLLVRNRTALFVGLLMPPGMVLVTKSALNGMDLGKAGLNLGQALVISGIGLALVLVVHLNLVSAYVSRREELVLKRLRTGELSDREILAGTALPSVGLALAQVVLVSVAGIAFLDAGAPQRPELLLVGLALGVVLLVALSAATAVVTRTTESAQVTTLPMFFVSMFGSGLLIPLDVLPDKVASVCELLPLTGAMTLVRAGWAGGVGGGELLGAAGTALAWTVLAVFAVQRWFRWEPRR
ncbi:ABC transporter permease [Streptomyces sp. NPDC001941]|uniref:ABC transporter permease n=1 Tax=Streptomyces sp. NPDC001941 TaxID=3154659 RepID=UPI00332520F0